ncbi:Rrf2 family transcriptional regulator [Paracoccus sp. (in: a-proteobacteria)]|uniref:RrF2 family transcriptional regulator n=1 Tax=Paracoccus sp. TaxID=267 RepID=UPI0032205DD6
MISQKTKYAIKALMVLADEQAAGGGALTIEEIAQRSGAPKRFLEHIMLDLRKMGHVDSRRGRSGGYALVRRPAEISIGALLRQVDGPIAPLPCLSRHSYQPCEDCREGEADCRLRRMFGQLFWSYLLLVESLTLEDVLARGGLPDPGQG